MYWPESSKRLPVSKLFISLSYNCNTVDFTYAKLLLVKYINIFHNLYYIIYIQSREVVIALFSVPIYCPGI